jgi:hypothetical protein
LKQQVLLTGTEHTSKLGRRTHDYSRRFGRPWLQMLLRSPRAGRPGHRRSNKRIRPPPVAVPQA